jgi:formate--tetrahydrofolate ligase
LHRDGHVGYYATRSVICNSAGQEGPLGGQNPIRPILDVAGEAGLHADEVEPYGSGRAKISPTALARLAGRDGGRLVVVTAITPTSAGEGKTTTSIGLTEGLRRVGADGIVCLREPSMGPVFGRKGGGTGGGRSEVVPMEDVNLHLNGDLHAVSAAHNLLAAATDASLYHGNRLGIDPTRIGWPRCIDMNDRALRHIVTGLGGGPNGGPRESGFIITAASEVMAILGLASDLKDLRARVGRIQVGETRDGGPVTAEDLRVAGAMTVLLKEAIRPNLVQTTEGGAALVHTGPFGNIAHGNSSIVATRLALKLADIVVTEGGFGSDLGFEKFCHIVSPAGGFVPSAAVVVATARALKVHGGLPESMCEEVDLDALKRGTENLAAHIDIVRTFGLPAVVAINVFPSDTERELETIRGMALEMGAHGAVLHRGFALGGEGAEDLAGAVLGALEAPSSFRPLNAPNRPLREQIEAIATTLYGADGVDMAPQAERDLERLRSAGMDRLPVCMAKTHLSLSHDAALKGRPLGFRLPVRQLIPATGAGFVVALTGDVLRMPGLGRDSAYTRIDVDEEGRTIGLV